MALYDDLMQVAASGMYSISGNYNPSLVTAGQGGSLADLLAIAGADGDAVPPGTSLPAMQAALAQKIVNNGLVVTNTRPTKARQFPLGFESAAAIAPGATAQITSRPQVPFRGERLTVPSDIAGSFSILDLRVGKNSQFVNAGAVPARVFQENATNMSLQCDTAQISQDVTISVQNIGGAPQTFRAALMGSALDG